jgi:hypothetical protein
VSSQVIVRGKNRPKQRPTIPEPFTTPDSLHACIVAIKEAVELLQGQRGTYEDAVVSWGDLVRLGLIKPDQIPKEVK